MNDVICHTQPRLVNLKNLGILTIRNLFASLTPSGLSKINNFDLLKTKIQRITMNISYTLK